MGRRNREGRNRRAIAAVALFAVAGCGHRVIDPGPSPTTQRTPAPIVAQPAAPPVGESQSLRQVPAAQVLPTSARQQSQEYYQVRPGDTLQGIAQAHGLSLQRLLDRNGLDGSTLLQPGQLIYIPPAR